jgi:hypothetical protein
MAQEVKHCLAGIKPRVQTSTIRKKKNGKKVEKKRVFREGAKERGKGGKYDRSKLYACLEIP